MQIDKKQLLIEAAIEILQSENFSSMKTAAVAAEAGVSEGTIYRYFSSKRELFIMALIEVSNRIKIYFLSSISQHNSLIDNLITLVDHFYERSDEIDRYYRVLFKASSEIVDEEIKSEMKQLFDNGVKEFKRFLTWELNRRNLPFNQSHIEIAFMMIWGFADLLWRQEVIYDRVIVGRKELTDMINVFQGLLNHQS